jgi:hypothetical protein
MPLHLSATEKQAFERAAILDSLRQALHTKRCARMKTDVFLSTAKLPTNRTRRFLPRQACPYDASAIVDPLKQIHFHREF